MLTVPVEDGTHLPRFPDQVTRRQEGVDTAGEAEEMFPCLPCHQVGLHFVLHAAHFTLHTAPGLNIQDTNSNFYGVTIQIILGFQTNSALF